MLREELATMPVEVEQDEAGNLWAYFKGRSTDTVVVGSHLDSVPAGGWLDGALGVMGGLEVLRSLAAAPTPPQRSFALVDWADEEGARFSRSLFGSAAVAGTLDVDIVRELKDRWGNLLPDVVAEHGVVLDALDGCRTRLEHVVAYLELHIEQGPILEHEGLGIGIVTGTYGIERERLVFSGQAAHAGTMPMGMRRDSLRALVRSFADPRVGGVAGNQVYLRDGEQSLSADGECWHWNLDTWQKDLQSRAGSATSATGAIYAIRAACFDPVPLNVMDDFHISTGVIARGLRLVFAADRAPQALDGVEQRLLSRLSMGLVADIQPADIELRRSILEHRLARFSPAQVPADVIEFLARTINRNIRELVGGLNKLIAYAQLTGQAVSLQLAEEQLTDILSANRRRITIDEIQKACAAHYRIDAAEMRSHRRARAVARPRQVAMYLCKQLTDLSYPEIGRQFNDKHHSTVIYSVEKIAALRKSDPELDRVLDTLVKHFA